MGRKFFNQEQAALASVTGSVPQEIKDKLSDLSHAMRVPVSILVARAIYNEFECAKPFDADLSLPELRYDEPSSTDDSQKLFAFIRKYPGLSLEHFIMCRWKIGISDANSVKKAYAILRNAQVITEYYPQGSKFQHPREYRVCEIASRNREEEYKRGPKKGPLSDL